MTILFLIAFLTDGASYYLEISFVFVFFFNHGLLFNTNTHIHDITVYISEIIIETFYKELLGLVFFLS